MKPRGRPQKYRFVHHDPRIRQFSPRGRPGRPDETDLGVDEVEALRLADSMGMSQKDASKLMKISQQTFSRIVRRARKKVADALSHGRLIRIKGGQYVLDTHHNFPHKSFVKSPWDEPKQEA